MIELGTGDVVKKRAYSLWDISRIGVVTIFLAAASLTCWAAYNSPRPAPDFSGEISGVAFSPFQRGQSPENNNWPSSDDIVSDLKAASSITTRIRTYSTDGGLDRIPSLASSNGLPLRITMGAWLDRDRIKNTEEIRRLISGARGSTNVDRLVVGNETILRGDLTTRQLAVHLNSVRQMLPMQVSTAEPWHVWLDHPELADSVDFITIHLLPYWEGLRVDEALRFVMDKYDAVSARFPGKRIVVGEVGWPSDGRDIGAARASRVNQAAFLRGFFQEAERRGIDYFVMEAFDQPWKVSFEGRAAGHWGMFDLDRRPKWRLTGGVHEVADWPLWAAGSTIIAIILSVGLLTRRPDLKARGILLMTAVAHIMISGLTLAILRMSETYLDLTAATVWGALLVGQALLVFLVLADAFELSETLWGVRWRRSWPALPEIDDSKLPKASIHIPICNEPAEMVIQTLDALSRLDYPNFEVLIVDNNTKDPSVWAPVAAHCAKLGSRFRFFTLGKWPGYKAGALNFALRETAEDAEFIGIVDSDYVVNPDWLRKMIPFFSRKEVGFTQSPQDYRDSSDSVFKRMMYWEYAGFFQCGMVTRNERNAIIQHGTMTIVRKSALLTDAGWAEWCICEDSELGLRLFERGWEAVYVPDSMGRGVMPDDFSTYRKQRYRWAYGAIQIAKGHLGSLFNPFRRDLTLGQRWHFVAGWMPWVGDALGLLFVALGIVWSIGLIFAPVSTEFPVVLFMLPSLSLFGFKLAQVLTLYSARVPCGLADRCGAAIAGLALTHTIGKAVLRGIFTKKLPFMRTPKMVKAPAFMQGFLMAREELTFLIAIWSSAAGVMAVHRNGTWEATLWVGILVVQSMPYLASVAVSLVASAGGTKSMQADCSEAIVPSR